MSNFEIVRRDALNQRISGVGGKRILWSNEDKARLEDFYMSAPEALFRTQVERKFTSDGKENYLLRSRFEKSGTVAKSEKGATYKWLWRISSEAVDLSQDVIKAGGIRLEKFSRNPVVLFCHDSGEMPVAESSTPWVYGNSLFAFATFPNENVSAQSDQVSAMVRAGMLRGASIGFIPIKYEFSKDPSRPLGIDFNEIMLLEWSVCSLPCNSTCLLVGPAGEKQGAPQSDAEARAAIKSKALYLVRNARAKAG